MILWILTFINLEKKLAVSNEIKENVTQLEPKTKRQKKNLANSVSLKAQHEAPEFPTLLWRDKQALKQE